MSTKLEFGDLVKVDIPLSESDKCKPIMKYNGKVLVVADAIGCPLGTYYHLVGAEGRNGVPYCFTRDWLIKR